MPDSTEPAAQGYSVGFQRTDRDVENHVPVLYSSDSENIFRKKYHKQKGTRKMNVLIFLSRILSTDFGTMEVHDFARHTQSIDTGEMTLHTFLNYLWTTDFSTLIRELLKAAGLPAATMLALPLVILLGLLWCFLGLKLIRVWSAVMGMTVGLAAGIWDAQIFDLDPMIGWVLGIILGILLALVAVKFYQAGVFLAAWFVGSILAAMILHPADWIYALICVGIGLVAALIALRFAELSTIFLTAVWGAFSTAAGIGAALPSSGAAVRIPVTFILAAAGIAVQIMLEIRSRKKLVQGMSNPPLTEDDTVTEAEANAAVETNSEKVPDTTSAEKASDAESTENPPDEANTERLSAAGTEKEDPMSKAENTIEG